MILRRERDKKAGTRGGLKAKEKPVGTTKELRE